MFGRQRFAVGLPVWIVLAMLLPPTASAALRVPQVAISGDGLQGALNGAGESIDVRTDQDEATFLSTFIVLNLSYFMQVYLKAKPAGHSIGFYNAADANPVLYEVFPPAAAAGWFAVITFRNSPVRATVILLDDQFQIVSNVTYFGADKHAIGFYLDYPDARFYSQDQRNPAGEAQFLFFRGKNINAGDWWIAGEDRSRSGGADGDFDDVLIYVDDPGYIVPVQRSSWGTLKARFR